MLLASRQSPALNESELQLVCIVFEIFYDAFLLRLGSQVVPVTDKVYRQVRLVYPQNAQVNLCICENVITNIISIIIYLFRHMEAMH